MFRETLLPSEASQTSDKRKRNTIFANLFNEGGFIQFSWNCEILFYKFWTAKESPVTRWKFYRKNYSSCEFLFLQHNFVGLLINCYIMQRIRREIWKSGKFLFRARFAESCITKKSLNLEMRHKYWLAGFSVTGKFTVLPGSFIYTMVSRQRRIRKTALYR